MDSQIWKDQLASYPNKNLRFDLSITSQLALTLSKKLINYYLYQNTVMRIIKQNFKYLPILEKRPFHSTKEEAEFQQFPGEVDCGE